MVQPSGCGAMRDIRVAARPLCPSRSILCERHRPFVLRRPATATPATPQRELPLANTVRELNAGDRDRGVRERPEAGHRCAPLLNRAMVLFDQIIEVLVGPHVHVPPARMLAPQQPQSTTARDVSVERHLARHTRERRGKSLSEERLCDCNSPVASEQEIDGLAVLVDGAIEIVALRFDRDVRLVHAPRRADRLGETVSCEALGFRWLSEPQRRALVRALQQDLTRTRDRQRLLVCARRWLYDHQLIIMHERSLRSIIVSATRQYQQRWPREFMLGSIVAYWNAGGRRC